MKKFNCMLEIDIFRNSFQKYLGVLKDGFVGLGVQKMPCWLILYASEGPAGIQVLNTSLGCSDDKSKYRILDRCATRVTLSIIRGIINNAP